MRVSCVVFDVGGTITCAGIDPRLGQKLVDPAAAQMIRDLHAQQLTVLIASNTTPEQTRWPALQEAGIADLITCALLSHALGVAKPDPRFYALVLAAAACPAGQVLFVGNNLDHDVRIPLWMGMNAALVRPDGIRPDDHGRVPPAAHVIGHVTELPALLGLPHPPRSRA